MIGYRVRYVQVEVHGTSCLHLMHTVQESILATVKAHLARLVSMREAV